MHALNSLEDYVFRVKHYMPPGFFEAQDSVVLVRAGNLTVAATSASVRVVQEHQPFGTLGHHLKVLKEAGLVELDGDGYKATLLAEALMGDFIIVPASEVRRKIREAEELYRRSRDEAAKAIADALKWVMSIGRAADEGDSES